jgi:hypothetical protein
LPDLFADPRLRCIKRFGRVGHVETVVDHRAKISNLLEIHGVITKKLAPAIII